MSSTKVREELILTRLHVAQQYRLSRHFYTDEGPCKPGLMKCEQSRRCIQVSWRCDGDDDCGDSSDEQNCRKISKLLTKLSPAFNDPEKETFKKHCGKRRKCWLPAFSPFPVVLSTVTTTNFDLYTTSPPPPKKKKKKKHRMTV